MNLGSYILADDATSLRKSLIERLTVVKIVRFCLIVIAALVIASCASIGASEINFVTLRGQVIAGPACPDQINMSGCENQPVEGALLSVLDSEGQEVTQVSSDKSGQFSVKLQPGRYYLVPRPVPGLMWTPGKLEVVVDKMSLTPITIKYDTGIRSVTPPPLPN